MRSVLLVALGLAISAAPASAAVLSFDAAGSVATPGTCGTTNCGQYALISQSYGDTAGINVTYGKATSFGGTATAGNIAYDTTPYAGLSGVAYNNGGSATYGEIAFVSNDLAQSVTVTSFAASTYGGWGGGMVKIYDLANNLLQTYSIGTTAQTITANVTAVGGVRVQFGSASGGQGFITGLDNILYSGGGAPAQNVSSTPEPAGWAMMLGGFGLIGTTLRNRRQRRLAFQG